MTTALHDAVFKWLKKPSQRMRPLYGGFLSQQILIGRNKMSWAGRRPPAPDRRTTGVGSLDTRLTGIDHNSTRPNATYKRWPRYRLRPGRMRTKAFFPMRCSWFDPCG